MDIRTASQLSSRDRDPDTLRRRTRSLTIGAQSSVSPSSLKGLELFVRVPGLEIRGCTRREYPRGSAAAAAAAVGDLCVGDEQGPECVKARWAGESALIDTRRMEGLTDSMGVDG